MSTTVRRLHASGAFEEGLELVSHPPGGLGSEHGATLTYWRACFLSLLDRPQEAVGELLRGASRGEWWAPSMLEGDTDLAAAKLDDGFAAILADSRAAWRSALRDQRAEPITLLPPRGASRAALVVLHGGRGSGEDIVEMWAPAAALGCHVAIPGRGQVLTSDDDLRNWTDPGLTREAVTSAIGAVGAVELPLLIAGFSAGGREALRIGLSGDPAIFAGVLAFAPSTLDTPGIDRRIDREPRVWLFVGDDDSAREGVLRLVDEMRTLGLSVSFERAPDLAHELPSDMARHLSSALDHVLSAD